jgi:beta-glucanase (GH16 family)
MKYGPQGAEFFIDSEFDAPTVESHWNIFFGRVDVVLKASTGKGIVSSVVLESDDLDEIDWEWLGGDYTSVESNYFGKGDTTTYDRAIYHPISNPQLDFHTYSIDWSPERINWEIDGAVIRTLTYDAAAGGSRYPQTPMKLKLGSWVGGSASLPEGTVQWAGGLADFTQGPFTMFVKSITVKDAQQGAKSYTYGDNSGSWQSIIVEGGQGANFQETSASISSAASTSTSTSTIPSSTSTSTRTSTSSSSSSQVVTSSSTSSSRATTTSSSRSLVSSTVNGTTTTLPGGTGASSTGFATLTTSTQAPSATTGAPAATHTGAAGKQAVNLIGAVVAAAAVMFAL